MGVTIGRFLGRAVIVTLAALTLLVLLILGLFALGVWTLPGDEGSMGRPLIIDNRTDKHLLVNLPAPGSDEIDERFVAVIPPHSSVEATHACDFRTKLFAREWMPDSPSPNPGGRGTLGDVVEIRSGPSEGCAWVVQG
jgi:hypothetical protein